MIRELISQMMRSGDININAHNTVCAQINKERELDAKLHSTMVDFNRRTANTSNESLLQFRSLKREIRKLKTGAG